MRRHSLTLNLIQTLLVSGYAASVMFAASPEGKEQPSPAQPPASTESAGIGTPMVEPDILRVQELMDRAAAIFDEGERLFREGKVDEGREKLKAAVELAKHAPYSKVRYPTLERFYQDLKRDLEYWESSLAEDPGGEKRDPSERIEQPLEPAAVDAISDIDLRNLTVSSALATMVSEDVRASQFSVPITLNDRVFKMIEYFQNRGRSTMERGLSQSGKYLPLFRKVFDEEGVPQELVHLAQVESLYKPLAYSRAHAKGIWQFTRPAAHDYSLKLTPWIDERSDFEKSTRAAAKYLRELHRRFGDWHLALAGYNWGPARVDRILARYGPISYWDMVERAVIPRETANYLPSILATMIIASNPVKYGFEVTYAPSLEFDKVPVDRCVKLSDVAGVSGIPVDVLKDLNPELTRAATPRNHPNYYLRVPVGISGDLCSQIASLPEAPMTRIARYRVKRGDTLATVARRFRVSKQELAQVNHVSSKSRLRRNTLLVIPGRFDDVTVSPAKRTARASSYKVRRGDTWAAVARKTGVNSRTLKEINNFASGAKLKPGMILLLRQPRSREVADALLDQDERIALGAATKGAVPSGKQKLVYQVRRGDTVGSIARNFKIDIRLLRKWNQPLATAIRPGQRLTVYLPH